jgi:hypothetical protein
MLPEKLLGVDVFFSCAFSDDRSGNDRSRSGGSCTRGDQHDRAGNGVGWKNFLMSFSTSVI